MRTAADAPSRQRGLEELAVVLTAHANAEEAVLYPALVHINQERVAMDGYSEHAHAKVRFDGLAYLDTMSLQFLDQLENLRRGVLNHLGEEEDDRLLDLKNLPAKGQERFTAKYREQFDRYLALGKAEKHDAETSWREELAGGHILSAIIP